MLRKKRAGLFTAVAGTSVDLSGIQPRTPSPLPGLVKAMEEAHAAWKAQAERLFELTESRGYSADGC